MTDGLSLRADTEERYRGAQEGAEFAREVPAVRTPNASTSGNAHTTSTRAESRRRSFRTGLRLLGERSE